MQSSSRSTWIIFPGPSGEAMHSCGPLNICGTCHARLRRVKRLHAKACCPLHLSMTSLWASLFRRRGNVGEVLASKDDRGAIPQLARDLELEQVRPACTPPVTRPQHLTFMQHAARGASNSYRYM